MTRGDDNTIKRNALVAAVGFGPNGNQSMKKVDFDSDRLLSIIGPKLRSPNELEEYSTKFDQPSGTEITGDPSYKVSLATVIDKSSTTNFLGYFILDHQFSNEMQITDMNQSAADPYIKLVSGRFGKTELSFFRELVPINSKNNIIGATKRVKLTGFASSEISVKDGANYHGLNYGIEATKGKRNPNEYKIRARILSAPQRDFYTDEVFYSFQVEMNDQGNKFTIPIVLTGTTINQAQINPEDIKEGSSIDCNVFLQGSLL